MTVDRPLTDKEKLLIYVNNLPDDADIFSTSDEFKTNGCITIKVFPVPKTAKFYRYYFGV